MYDQEITDSRLEKKKERKIINYQLSIINYSVIFLVILGLSLSVPSSVWSDKDLTTEKSRLKKLQRSIKEQKRELSHVRSKEKSILKELSSIDKQLDRQETKIESFTRETKELEKNIVSNNKEIERITVRRAEKQRELGSRVRALYKFGEAGWIRVLFSSNSYSDFISRVKFSTILLDYDDQLASEYQDVVEELSRFQKQLRKRKVRKSELLTSLATEKKLARNKKNERSFLLKKVRNEKGLKKRALKEMEGAAGALQATVKSLTKRTALKRREKTVPSGQSFSRMKGRLPRPVRGKVVSRFGSRPHGKFKTTLWSKGVRFQAGVGEDIKAVHGGKVIFSDWFRGYGKLMIVDHGDGYYTLYAHANRLFKQVGEEVKGGEVIGLVGQTSSWEGPALYFEIRHHGVATDPMKWLN